MNKLSVKVINILKKKGLTLSLAESCTGGLLASSFTSISGSSKIFKLGLVTYSNESKINILNIPKKIINKYGAVSHETCRRMVINVTKLSKTKMGISITGIAGPKGGSYLKPVGLVYIGIKYREKIIIKRCLFKSKNRNKIQKSTVRKVLYLILDLFK